MARKKKAEAAEVALRVEEVLRIRLDGAQYHDVVQYAAEKGWELKERQLRLYMSRADDLLVERQEKQRRRIVAQHLARRESLYARAVNAADYRTGLAVLSDLAKLQRLYEPERDNNSAAGSRLTLEEAKEVMRQAVLELPPPPTGPPDLPPPPDEGE